MTAPELSAAQREIRNLALRDKVANALNECECSHFVNEHNEMGCLASLAEDEGGIYSEAEHDWLCDCMRSPRAIQEGNVAAMVADAAHEAEGDLADARGSQDMANALAKKVMAERDVLAKELADLRGAVEALTARWEDVRFYEVAAMQLRNSFTADLRALLNASSNP